MPCGSALVNLALTLTLTLSLQYCIFSKREKKKKKSLATQDVDSFCGGYVFEKKIISI